jgi:murein DD-endopeptidase MepM/ murein hydrolase activator NlpD
MNAEDKNSNIIFTSNTDKTDSFEHQNIFKEFFHDWFTYLRLRIRQLGIFVYAAMISTTSWLATIKEWSVRRMYWGRSSLYRTVFHTIVFGITVVSLLVGISQRINIFKDSGGGGLVLASGIVGNYDQFYQAGTADSIALQTPSEKAWPEYKYTVKAGDTLQSIADNYGVNTATIQWANNLNTDKLRTNQVLIVPGLNGVLYTVGKGDTVKSVAKKVSGNEFDIEELNQLTAPDFKLAEGQQIFIPNGVIIKKNSPGDLIASYITFSSDPGITVAPGAFVNPLSVFCPGYYVSRGLTNGHTGYDLAKAGGCWVNAGCSGKIEDAGNKGFEGGGFMIREACDNGFIALYYHGNGEYAIKKGDVVKAGQRMMYMGSSGNSTGVHLHFELRYNNQVVDPSKYIKF